MPPGSIYLYSFGVPTPGNADIDNDGDSDVHDAAWLMLCVSGHSPPAPADCARSDLDGSGQTDGADWLRLEACMAGVGVSPACP